MKKSRTTLLVLSLAVGSLFAVIAQADPRHHSVANYGRVVEVRPVYQRFTHQAPIESCHYETQAYRNGSSYTGAVAGGILGAAIGYELGHSTRNKEVAAVVGGLLGATVGHDLTRSKDSRPVHYRDREVCHTQYRTEYSQRVTGYDVTYSYRGQLYHTRSAHHPGDRIRVDAHPRAVRTYLYR